MILNLGVEQSLCSFNFRPHLIRVAGKFELLDRILIKLILTKHRLAIPNDFLSFFYWTETLL